MVSPGWAWAHTFRWRIVLVVLAVGVAPLALLGYWLAGSATRSGEALLRERLGEALRRSSGDLGARWVRLRSELLDLAEAPVARAVFAGQPSAELELQRRIPPALSQLSITNVRGRALTIAAANTVEDGETLGLTVPVYDRDGTRLGSLAAAVPATYLIAAQTNVPGLAGVVIAAFDPATGRSLLPLPFDPELVAGGRFVWGGEAWLAIREELAEPPVVLVAAAPVAPFTAPFEAAARKGTLLLLAVASAGVLSAVLATGRLTRTLERLAAAADAVAAGDLGRKVAATGPREVSRVAQAFNTMTEHLRRTLHQLAQREAQAAAGEFAASLAHEVRNPLTAIRVDLQVVEERLPQDSPLREFQTRALQEIVRLDRTVGEALEQARRGHLGTRVLDLLEPLRAALHAATPELTQRDVPIPEIDHPASPVSVRGEPGALEQLFLNLLLNAAQAVERGGSVRVSVTEQQSLALVSITDSGPGIPETLREKVFQPFFSTREGGTGLGLPIARRIAQAHGGDIAVHSAPGTGTRIDVRIPLEA